MVDEDDRAAGPRAVARSRTGQDSGVGQHVAAKSVRRGTGTDSAWRDCGAWVRRPRGRAGAPVIAVMVRGDVDGVCQPHQAQVSQPGVLSSSYNVNVEGAKTKVRVRSAHLGNHATGSMGHRAVP
jgi:hypothetical protein